MSVRLTDKAVERLSPPPKGKEKLIFDAGAVGLGIKITPTGKRVWILWLRYPGQKHQTARTLGTFPAMGVAQARLKAGEWYAQVKRGLDPRDLEAEARANTEQERKLKVARSANTFGAYAEVYIARKTNRRAKEDAAEIRRMLLPALGRLPLHEITPRHVRELMAGLVAKAPYSALNGWTQLVGIFKHAVHDELIQVSPVASLDKKLIFKGANTGARQRVLNDEELFAFWRATGRLGYPFGDLYRLLLLTGVRLRELLLAKWTEFHPALRTVIRDAASGGRAVDWTSVPNEVKLWTVPRERFKSDAEHLVPLSDQACRLLAALPRFAGCDFLFTATGNAPVWASDKAKRRLDRRMVLTLRALARMRGEAHLRKS